MHVFDLSGKSAIVTGGNGGIGRGIALALAEAGASVCIAGRNEDKNAAVRTEIEALGGTVISQACDVNDKLSVAETLSSTVDAFGGVDILVNNAGIVALNNTQDVSDDEWQSVIETNLNSVFKFSRAAYPELAKHGGKIINIGSMTSLFGSPALASYAAS